MSARLTDAQKQRIRRLSDPRDPNDAAKLSNLTGIGVKAIRKILDNKPVNPWTPARKAQEAAKTKALQTEFDARWNEVKAEARNLLLAGMKAVDVAGRLEVSAMRTRNLRAELRRSGELKEAA